jgi:Tfp pilus assembly protein PilF
VSTDPDDTRRSDDHNARGIELADRGWLDESVKEFRRAIELDPGSAHARENLGAVLAEQRRYKEALVELLAAVELDPESPSVHFSLATFVADHGADMAAEGYRAALALDPAFPDAQLNLGLALADQQKTEEALAALGAAVSQAPDDALPRHELALLQMDEGDHRAAIVQLKEVVRLEPERYEGHLDLGLCYAEKGFLEEA